MATLEQIEAALRKADAAGNVEDARALAQAYRQMKQATPLQAVEDDLAGGQPEPEPEQAPWYERFADNVGRGAERVANAFTGNDRRDPNIQELTESDALKDMPLGENAKLGFGLLNANPRQQREILQKTLPDAAFSKDEYGNDVIGYKGEQYYINRPGLSSLDVAKLGYDAASFTPFGRAFGLTKAANVGRGLLNVGARSGGAAMAQNAAQQGVANASGADSYDAGDALLAGGLGAVTGGIGEGVARAVSSPARRSTESAGRSLADRLDLNFDELTPPQQAALRTGNASGQSPDEIRRNLQAASLPEPVQMTPAQASLDAGRMADQEGLEKGIFGEHYQRTAVDFLSGQRDALRRNQDALIDNLSPTGNRGLPGQGGEVAQQRLQALRAQDEQAARDAYGTARDVFNANRRGKNRPNIPFETAGKSYRNIMRDINEDFAPDSTGRVNGVLRAAFGQNDAPPAGPAGAVTPGAGEAAPAPFRIKNVNMQNLIRARRQLTSMEGQVDGRGGPTPDSVLASKAKKRLDDEIENLLASGEVKGSPEAFDAFSNANRLYSQTRQKYTDDRVLEKLSRPEENGAIAPEQVASHLFGSGPTSIGTGRASIKTIERVRDILGPDSPEWGGLRQDAFQRVLRAGDTGFSGRPDQAQNLSGARLRKAYDQAMNDNKSRKILETMFSQDELRGLRDLIDVTDNITNPVKGSVNSSNSATALMRENAQNAARLRQRIQFSTSTNPFVKGPIMNFFFKVLDGFRARKFGQQAQDALAYRVLPEGLGLPAQSAVQGTAQNADISALMPPEQR